MSVTIETLARPLDITIALLCAAGVASGKPNAKVAKPAKAAAKTAKHTSHDMFTRFETPSDATSYDLFR